MATMSTADRTAAARSLAVALFLDDVAVFDLTQLINVVGALDDALEAQIGTYISTDSVAVAINKQLPEPFKTSATSSQKSVAFAYTVMKKYGVT